MSSFWLSPHSSWHKQCCFHRVGLFRVGKQSSVLFKLNQNSNFGSNSPACLHSSQKCRDSHIFRITLPRLRFQLVCNCGSKGFNTGSANLPHTAPALPRAASPWPSTPVPSRQARYVPADSCSSIQLLLAAGVYLSGNALHATLTHTRPAPTARANKCPCPWEHLLTDEFALTPSP